jgi:hypothetical protein
MAFFLRPEVIAIVCLGTVCLAGAGQEPSSDPAAGNDAADKARQEEVSRLAPAKARQLEVLVGDDELVKAVLNDKPLLRWSNPTAGSVYGEVFLWTVADRPAAIASIFRWYHPFKDGTVEVVSLSTSAVAASEGGAVQWDSRSPGIAFQSLDGPLPATAKGVRLTQMRTLVRRFTAQLTDKRSGEAVVRDLRLLNQPIHRYESPEQGVLDGAVFAVAEVTDPEVIVLIEALTDSDKSAWRYALARMNNHELTVRLDDKVVQNFPAIDKPWSNRKATYTLFSFDPAKVKVDESAP